MSFSGAPLTSAGRESVRGMEQEKTVKETWRNRGTETENAEGGKSNFRFLLCVEKERSSREPVCWSAWWNREKLLPGSAEIWGNRSICAARLLSRQLMLSLSVREVVETEGKYCSTGGQAVEGKNGI